MKTISRKVSLEPLITRYPVCYPALSGETIDYLIPDSENALKSAHYGLIPLGVNEHITGDYNGFTEEMKAVYGGKTIHCYTLQKWMNQFRYYFNLITSNECHTVFDSAVDYYRRTYPDSYDISEAIRLDEEFNQHGGRNFYQWLLDYYFVALDFKGEYNRLVTEPSFTWEELCEWCDNIGLDFMTYPEAVSFFGKMSRMHELYGNNTDCSTLEDCCDCVDYYSYGGDLMYQFMFEWIEKINDNITTINGKVYDEVNDKDDGPANKLELTPKTYLNCNLTCELEDLGVFVNFSKDFQKGHEYENGQVCTYDGVIYIYSGETPYKKEYFDYEGWVNYYDEYIKEHEDEEDIPTEELPPLKGRTVSSLDSFTRTDETVDGMGNILPGYFKPNSESYFMQPAENSLLDFIYQPGTCRNLEEVELDEAGIAYKLYICDYLSHITFFYKDLNGDIIESSKKTASGLNSNVVEKIEECINSVTGDTFHQETIYADFYYYKSTKVKIYIQNQQTVIERANDDNSIIIDGGPTTNDGAMLCIDHCTIKMDTCQYHMSDKESYPLRYYKVNLDIEKHYSSDYQKEVNVAMCDFELKPSNIGSMAHTASPLLRKEELLPYANAETSAEDIYIDRGYATVLDRHLRIGEVSNYSQLEKYGNGMFTIFNADEETD